MQRIKLSNGLFCLVDDEDLNRLLPYRWYFKKDKFANTGYAFTQVDKKTIYMHRLIMGVKKGDEVDHKNRNGLDNQKENLRICSHSQNKANIKKMFSLSKLRGVYQFKHQRKKWFSQIQVNGRQIYLGTFEDKQEAGKAYDRAAKFYFGEFAQLNFCNAL